VYAQKSITVRNVGKSTRAIKSLIIFNNVIEGVLRVCIHARVGVGLLEFG